MVVLEGRWSTAGCFYVAISDDILLQTQPTNQLPKVMIMTRAIVPEQMARFRNGNYIQSEQQLPAPAAIPVLLPLCKHLLVIALGTRRAIPRHSPAKPLNLPAI
jgi:hypothetical protein